VFIWGRAFPEVPVSRRFLFPAIAVLALASQGACQKPETADGSNYSRYSFDLRIEKDATAGYVCIASVTDQISMGTLRTQPFRAMPGKVAHGSVDEPTSGARLEATIKVDAEARRATYLGKLTQKGQRTVVFEATRDLPKP
jgi:hypothetical protein